MIIHALILKFIDNEIIPISTPILPVISLRHKKTSLLSIALIQNNYNNQNEYQTDLL